MNLLAIDCGTSILSVAISRGQELFYSQTDAGMRQSEIVMDFIDSQMKCVSLKPGDLNAVLCGGGPGSFTGLRIGYSIAKGLALSLSIPFVPVPALECISVSDEQLTKKTVLAVIEARKNAYFFAFFKDGQRLSLDRDADIAQITDEIRRYTEQITITGPGAALFYDSLPQDLKERTVLNNEDKGYAREIIIIAKKRKVLDNDNTAYLYSGPEYIRKTDAEINLMEKTGVIL